MGMMYTLHARDLHRRDFIDGVNDFKEKYGSFDKCMSQNACKIPVIIVIAVLSIVLISLFICLLRCCLCGYACCACCCGGCGGRKHKRPQPQAVGPVGPMPVRHSMAPPQYAYYGGDSKNADALPEMPTLGGSTVREEEVVVESSYEMSPVQKMNPFPPRPTSPGLVAPGQTEPFPPRAASPGGMALASGRAQSPAVNAMSPFPPRLGTPGINRVGSPAVSAVGGPTFARAGTPGDMGMPAHGGYAPQGYPPQGYVPERTPSPGAAMGYRPESGIDYPNFDGTPQHAQGMGPPGGPQNNYSLPPPSFNDGYGHMYGDSPVDPYQQQYLRDPEPRPLYNQNHAYGAPPQDDRRGQQGWSAI